MIVFEKDNKLNINFENKLDTADIQIGKSEIKVDGNNIVSGGSGGSAAVMVHMDETYKLDKTAGELKDLFSSNTPTYFEEIVYKNDGHGGSSTTTFKTPLVGFQIMYEDDGGEPEISAYFFTFIHYEDGHLGSYDFFAESLDDYPVID